MPKFKASLGDEGGDKGPAQKVLVQRRRVKKKMTIFKSGLTRVPDLQGNACQREGRRREADPELQEEAQEVRQAGAAGPGEPRNRKGALFPLAQKVQPAVRVLVRAPEVPGGPDQYQKPHSSLMPLALKIIRAFENHWGSFEKYEEHLGPVLSYRETGTF